MTFFSFGCPNFFCRCVWGLPLMEWLKGPMGPALNKSLCKHQHHQVYLPTSIPLPCTWSFYPALASQTVQDLTSSDLSSLHRLLFEAETRTRYEIYLSTRFSITSLDQHVKQLNQPVNPASGLLSLRGSASFAKTSLKRKVWCEN